MRRWVTANKGAAVAIAAAVALVAAGLLVRRSGPDAVSTPTTAAADTVADPVDLRSSSSTVTPASGSSSRLEMPVDPSGSRQVRSEAGARQTAIDYLSTVKQRFLYLAPEPGRGLLEAWRAPGVTDRELTIGVEQFHRLRDALSAAGGEVWWVVSPLAVKVEAYDHDRARVAVWTATVLAAGAAPGVDATVPAPSVFFRTGAVDLVWVSGSGWSVWSASDSPGPVPMLAPEDPPSSPPEFLAALAGFGLVREHR